MDIWVNATQSKKDILECISMMEIQQASTQDDHLHKLKHLIITGWPNTKDMLQMDLKTYLSYRDELAVIDGVILKGRHIIIPTNLRHQILEQLHTSHMGIEKTKFLACESVYWSSINADIDNFIQICPTCLHFQQTQPKEKIIHHNIPLNPWEVISADVFHFNNKNYLCIIDYNSKFPVVKKLEGLSVESLITTTKIIFAKYGNPQKVMSDASMNFVSDRFHQFCKSINIEQAVSSAHHHQSNGQVEACIKLIKCTFKKCTNAGRDINVALLQICTTPLGQGLPSPTTLMFGRPVCSIMPVVDHKPIGQDYDDKHHHKLVDRQPKNDNDALPVFEFILIGSTVVVHEKKAYCGLMR